MACGTTMVMLSVVLLEVVEHLATVRFSVLESRF